MSLFIQKLLIGLLIISLSTCWGEDSLSPMSAKEDSGSIEMPTPVRRERSGPPQRRPILELVLGVLDTLHSSTQSELKRIKARQARQNKGYVPALSTTTTSMEQPSRPKASALRKRLNSAKL